MGRQVNFYADNEDLAELLVLAEKKGLSVIPKEIAADSEPLVTRPAEYVLDRNQDGVCYFWPGDTSKLSLYYEVNEYRSGTCMIDDVAAPVFELWIGALTEERVERGRIYVTTGAAQLWGTKGLVSYYNALERHIKKWPMTDTQYRYKTYVGPHAAQRVRKGSLQLGNGKTGLRS